MKDIKVATGIWFLGATSDRFVKEGYRPDISIEERFKLAASVEAVGGLEMHYPTEVTDENYKDLKQLADDLGMKIVQLAPHFGHCFRAHRTGPVAPGIARVGENLLRWNRRIGFRHRTPPPKLESAVSQAAPRRSRR